MARGWYNMACWNGLSADQQRQLVEVGALPFGYVPAGSCLRGADVEVTTMYDVAPGPRFYCRECAAKFLSEEAQMEEIGPIYDKGLLLVENSEIIAEMDLTNCQFGLQVATDGRVWVCVNGMAFLRFKPTPGEVITTKVPTDRVLADLTDSPPAQWE